MSKIEWFHSGTLMEARIDGEVVGFIKEFNDMHSVYIGETEKRIGSFHRYKNAQAALEKAVASHVPEPQEAPARSTPMEYVAFLGVKDSWEVFGGGVEIYGLSLGDQPCGFAIYVDGEYRAVTTNNKGKFIALKSASSHQLAKRIRELKRLTV